MKVVDWVSGAKIHHHTLNNDDAMTSLRICITGMDSKRNDVSVPYGDVCACQAFWYEVLGRDSQRPICKQNAGQIV